MRKMSGKKTKRPTPFRGLRSGAARTGHAMRDGWRAILIAIIGGALGLLIAEALGDSDDGKAIAALLGAAAGATAHHLAVTLHWRDRTLSAIAAVAGALALPGARRWVVARTRSAAWFTAPTKATALGLGVLTVGIGALSLQRTGGATEPAGSARAGTPEDAIAAYMQDKPGEYVGSCAGRSQREFDAHPRRVCSVPSRAQGGGRLFAIKQPGWLDQVPVVLLREDDDTGWRVVRCVLHC